MLEVKTWQEGGLRLSGLKCYSLSLHASGGTEEQRCGLSRFRTNRAVAGTELNQCRTLVASRSGFPDRANDVGEMASSAPS